MSVSFFGGRRGDGNDEGETKATDEKSERPGRDTMNLRQVHGRPQRFHEPDDFPHISRQHFPSAVQRDGRLFIYFFQIRLVRCFAEKNVRLDSALKNGKGNRKDSRRQKRRIYTYT